MAKPWKEVAASPEFQALKPREQVEAMRQYFDEVVAPKVPEIDRKTARAEFERYALKTIGEANRKAADPTKDMSSIELGLAGVGKAFHDTATGVGQMLGLKSKEDAKANQLIDAPLMETTAGKVGHVVGDVAATTPLMLANPASTTVARLGQAASAGAASGMLQPVTEGDFLTEKAKQATVGALAGGVGGGIAEGISRVVSPAVSRASGKAARAGMPDAEASKMLANEGVTLTPGQTVGGAAKRLEDASTSIPLYGDVVKSAQRRAIEDFNRATLNKIVRPLGVTLKKTAPIGHEGVESVGKIISRAYDDVLEKIGHVQFDRAGSRELARLVDLAQWLPDKEAAQFNKIITGKLFGKVTPKGRMSAEAMKEIDSELGRYAAKYHKSVDPDQRDLGDAFREAQAILRRLVAKAHPEHASALRKVDRAYSRLLRVERAARAAKGNDGVFMPSQLQRAIEGMDNSLRKRATARGKADMQTWANAGAKVLPNKVPDSGTPLRSAVGAGALGGVAAVNPLYALGAMLSAAGYTKPAQKAIMAAAMKRPEIAPMIAEAIQKAAIPAGAAAGLVANE